MAFLAYCLQVTLKARLRPLAGGMRISESVTGHFGIVTGVFGNVTGDFGDVTAGLSAVS